MASSENTDVSGFAIFYITRKTFFLVIKPGDCAIDLISKRDLMVDYGSGIFQRREWGLSLVGINSNSDK